MNYKRMLRNFVNILPKFKQKSILKAIKSSCPIESPSDPSIIRNIGTIAHIDAGKTSFSERLLFYSGVIPYPGSVDHGDTKMDYFDLERERGITIKAAATSFLTENCHINLIDTPGHMDFSAEVIRSLKMLEGAIVVFDSVEGVQPQSEFVWILANDYNLPKICFLNKMDRMGSSVNYCLNSIKSKLNTIPLLFSFPLEESTHSNTYIYIPEMKLLHYKDEQGKEIEEEFISKTSKIYPRARNYYNELIDQLANYSPEIENAFLSSKEISIELIDRAISYAMSSGKKIVPVFSGSCIKNRGIQITSNSLIKYFPSPASNIAYFTEKFPEVPLIAQVFKVINDSSRGPICFIRVFKGKILKGDTLLIASTKQSFKIQILARMIADEIIYISFLNQGDIGAIVGNDHLKAGDTIITTESPLIELEKFRKSSQVYSCGFKKLIETEEKSLIKALGNLEKEDPSISFTKDKETNQVVVSGLGELQLEIVQERLKREYKVNTEYTNIKIKYRESIFKSSQIQHKIEKQLLGKNSFFSISLEITPSTNKNLDERGIIKFDLEEFGIEEYNLLNENEKFYSLDSLPKDIIHSIFETANDCMENGPLLGFPLYGVNIKIINGRWSNIRTTSYCAKLCMKEAFQKLIQDAEPILLEPNMKVSINTPSEHFNTFLNDIIRKRGIFEETSPDNSQSSQYNSLNRRQIEAIIPLSELKGYSSKVRQITRGEGWINLKLHSFQKVEKEYLENLISNQSSL